MNRNSNSILIVTESFGLAIINIARCQIGYIIGIVDYLTGQLMIPVQNFIVYVRPYCYSQPVRPYSNRQIFLPRWIDPRIAAVVGRICFPVSNFLMLQNDGKMAVKLYIKESLSIRDICGTQERKICESKRRVVAVDGSFFHFLGCTDTSARAYVRIFFADRERQKQISRGSPSL